MARNYAAERMLKNPPTHSILKNRSPSSDSSEDEMHTDDEHLDNQSTPRPTAYFVKTSSVSHPKMPSTLTQMLHSEDNESFDEGERTSFQSSRRGLSTASTWSNPSLTSDGLTSADSRANSPSPPPPATITLPPVVAFGRKTPQRQAVVIKDHSDSIDPLQRSQTPDTSATAFEAGLGRKRCIAFACGRKDADKAKLEAAQTAVPTVEEPPKRKCMLTFVCPNKKPNDEAPTRSRKPTIGRKPSPAPVAMRYTASSQKLRRSLTSSSQLPTQKTQHTASTASRPRRLSTAGENDTITTERACEFAGTHNEDDDWMKERTCHRNRLTVNDTLKVELGLQKIGREAAEEEESEDEAELDNEGLNEDEDVDEAADADVDDLAELNANGDDESDAGFDSDDEGGMADSDEESDTDSDYHWWAPGRSTAATSYEQLDHMHFTRQRNMSGSSIGSLSSNKVSSGEEPKSAAKKSKKGRSIPIRTRESDLPDSTDFVCGTLDEDRPMEESFRRDIEMRRAAKHRACPQDIDPTFPTSDPEMDEEDDDDDVFAKRNEDESDGVFGHFEQQDDVKGHLDSRGRIRRGRSPVPSPPKRLRSPPPKRPTVHRSPPPRRLFGQSPKRLRSPPPYVRLRSPPPTRRASFAKSPRGKRGLLPSNTLAERPQQQAYSASLPRQPNLLHAHYSISPIPDADDSGEETMRGNLPARGAIDIVKGLEKKRQLRKEKLYQKYCRQRANGTVKPKEGKRCAPGKGAEKMREKGLELAGRWNGEKKYTYGGMADSHDAQHILSL